MSALRLAILITFTANLGSAVSFAVPPVRLRPAKAAFEVGRIRAGWELRRFRRAFSGHALSAVTPFHNGFSAEVSAARVVGSDQQVVVRQLSDVATGVRLQNAMHQLAHQLAAGELVLPSAASVLPQDQRGLPAAAHVMLTAHAGAGFLAMNKAPEAWTAKVSESKRIVGALLDLITRQTDRKPNNLLINEEGDLRLIDHDLALGHTNGWLHRSMFYPGGVLGYRSKQETLADLPHEGRALITKLAALSRPQLARAYKITFPEAAELHAQVKRVRDFGLSRAIEMARTEGQRPHFLYPGHHVAANPGYVTNKRSVTALRGVSVPGHMLNGPYLSYEPGTYRVEFGLKAQRPTGRVANIEVYDAASQQILALREVGAQELPSGGAEGRYGLDVEVPAGNRLCFRVYWFGNSDSLQASDIRIR